MSTVTHAGALLDAGAVLPAGAAPAHDDTIDTLTTRAYRNPVLGERTVVRLVPRTLGQAEDLTMEFLGFDAPDTVTEVGVVRQQALGFPAWALVHDPANGHHALALVKEVERLARVAKSRIGPAKDGFDKLAEQLARSVPHFLPTYYEEAARAFLAADSQSYAASMFGKARDAERSFALKIDEDRQHTVFLEFALAGALTAKALSAHSRDLAARCEPGTAYEQFRRLCVERTMGGLPPYAAMHTDLKRLARTAKMGDDAEEQVLAELLTAPSVARAPSAFWAAYGPALARLARRDPAMSGRLLTMFPRECTDDVWLGVLEESGATTALTAPAGTVATEAESSDGPAGWLVRFDDRREGYRRKRLPALLALVERMADRLKADGVPVKLCRTSDYVDFDLVDLCRSLGIPLAEASKNARYHVQQWIEDDTEGRRDLAEMATDARMRAGLAESIEKYLEPGWRSKSKVDPAKVAAIVAVPGLRAAVHWWFDMVADRVVERGLPTLGKELDRVTLLACPDGLSVNPEAVRRILDHRLGPVLGRTLRAGVLDEYGWPALESAVATVASARPPKPDEDEEQFPTISQWPHLVLRAQEQVLVVGGDGVEFEHLLRIPSDQRNWMWRTALRYVDGQLLVCWDIGSERAGYWSGAPDDVFITADDAYSPDSTGSIALPGGGRTAGGRPLHVGDRASQEHGRVAGDGDTYWVWTEVNDESGWHEYDVATGQVGRASLPAFFEDGAVDGEPLDLRACRLVPATPRMADSPLGYKDGLVGWRVRETAGDGCAGVAVDGRSFALPGTLRGDETGLEGSLVGALRFPGSDTTYGVLQTSGWRESGITLCTSDGFTIGRYKFGTERNTGAGRNKFAKGTRMLPPYTFWHYLRPRDEAGSAALRAVTDDQAQSLLAGATDLKNDAIAALVSRSLPRVTDASLVTGVAGIVKQAAKHQARLARFARVLAGEELDETVAIVTVEEESPHDAGRPTDKILMAALQGYLPYCYDRGRSAVRLIEAAGAALTGDGSVTKAVTDADHDWFQVLGALSAVMYRAVSPVTPADQREALLGLLEVCADSGLLTAGGRLRQVSFMPDDKKPAHQVGEVIQLGARRVVVVGLDSSDGELTALEYATDGQFGALAGHAILREHVLDTRGATPEHIAAFLPLARAQGPVPWRPEPVHTLSRSAGMSLAEATVLLAGLPNQEAWDQGQPAGWRETLPFTDEAVKMALFSWNADSRIVRGAIFAALLPADLAALWSDGPQVEKLAAWWTERHGARTPVSDDLITEAYKAGIADGVTATEMLHGFTSPATCRWLTGTAPGIDDAELLTTIVKALPWLVYRLPADHLIRQSLPAVLDLARKRLADPDLLLDVGHLEAKKVNAFTTALGVPVVSDEHGIDAGAVFFPPDTGWREVQLRPSRLTGSDDPVLAVLRTRLDHCDEGPIAAVRALLSHQLTDWVTYEVPAGVVGAEHDPSRAAPELVAEVVAAHGLSPDAATIYLQLLALPDPTDRKVTAWTGWKPARLKAARAELAGTALVVDAKRPRAGRTLFLPGGWLALRAPHLPLERWKLPLLVGDSGAVDGLDMVIPVAPVPRLFELAWARVRAGDIPRFDDLVTERRR